MSYEITDRDAGTGNQEVKITSIDPTFSFSVFFECPYCDFENRTVLIAKQIGFAFLPCGGCESLVDVMNPLYSIIKEINK